MPDRLTILRLAAAAGADPRTAQRWITGYDVKGCSLRERLAASARSLGVQRLASTSPSHPPPASGSACAAA